MTEIEELKFLFEQEKEARRAAEKRLLEHHSALLLAREELNDIGRPQKVITYSYESRNKWTLLESIFNESADALFIIDQDKNEIVSCNKRAAEMFETGSETDMIHSFEHLLFALIPNTLSKNILSEAYRTSKRFQQEIEFTTKRSNKFFGSISIRKFEENGNNFSLVQVSDITEKKKTEINLQKSQKRYRDLINHSHALICTHDLNGMIINLNHAALDAIRIQEYQVQGMNIQDLLSSEYKPEFQRYLDRIIANTSDKGIMLLQNKEGKSRYLMYQNYKVENDTEVPYVVGFAQDISDRIFIERKLKKAIATAEQSVKARKIFLANMSHEMRTPMNGILGMAGLLSKTNLDQKQTGYLNIIKNSADNLLIIINDILDVAKIESGKLQLEEIAFDVFDTVRTAVKSLTYKAEEKGLVIHTDLLQSDHNLVVGDPYRLNQVLINLLNNSLKFTSSGYVEISNKIVKEDDSHITFEFQVRDTGIGIASDKLGKIFEGFTQANPDITRKYGGTGLGLNICKNILEMQGGKISVVSELNSGSTFSFTISYKRALTMSLDKKNTMKINYKSLGKVKVLLVEDNDVNQYLAQSIMHEWGFEVVPAYHGKEALARLMEQDFDLVLMDIHMPEMDGLEATKAIRKLENRKKASIPIIAMTADAFKGEEEKYESAGMNDYLTKPFEEELLFTKIYTNLKSSDIVDNFEQSEIQNEKANGKLYDLSFIKTATHGNKETLKRMIHIFLNTTPGIVEEMEQSLQIYNYENIKESAHKLKTSIDTVGIASLKKEIRLIEELAASETDVEKIPALIQIVKQIIEQVFVQLRSDFENL